MHSQIHLERRNKTD